MGRAFKHLDNTSSQSERLSRSPEDALLKREHDDPEAIAKEAAKAGFSVDSYLGVRFNKEQVHRLRRMLKAGNEMIAAEKLRDPEKAAYMDKLLQAYINGLLGLRPEIDPAPPEPRNRGGAPKGNQNASKRRQKTTPH